MRVLAVVATLTCIGSVALAQEKDVHTLVVEANQACADGDYTAALETYQAVELTMPQSSELAYNRGVASYKLGDYAGARDAFNRSLRTQDLGLEAKAKFNLGNVAYALALRKVSTPREAIDLLKTAMVHYRDAIDLDPHDDDARANIELAQRMIRSLLDKLKQQQRDDQQERQQDGKDQQQQGEQQAGQESAVPEQQQKKPREETDDRMTPQEVERLLQAVRDKERRRRNDLARRRPPRRVPVTKDW